MLPNQYRDSKYKDKKVSRPPCLYNGNPNRRKDGPYIETGPKCVGIVFTDHDILSRGRYPLSLKTTIRSGLLREVPLYGPLARYVKLRVAHAPGMPGTLSPPPRVSDNDMHHGTWVTHVPWCMPGSLTSGLLWSWWRGKHSRHSWRMRNSQFYVSSKRPMACMFQGLSSYWYISCVYISKLT